MRLISVLLLLIAIPISTSAQISATTDDGRRVHLYEDGSWSYAEGGSGNVTYIHTGDGNRLKAGVREKVSNEIELQVAVENGEVRLVIWKEESVACQSKMREKKVFGEASLLLGETAIPLADRGRTGRQTVTRKSESVMAPPGHERSFCETWGMYHLTSGEVQKLRKSPPSRIRIEWKGTVRTQNEIISVSENRWTLRRQIKALGL